MKLSIHIETHNEKVFKTLTKLPKRSKFGVGKLIGGNLYVHKQYEDIIPKEVFQKSKKYIDNFEYNIIKYNIGTGSVTFIKSPDFDTSLEPIVGDSILIKSNGDIIFTESSDDPWIYHHKWLFVKDDYSGFDVEKSKKRSEQWTMLDNIDYRKIGKKSYWRQNVLPRLEKDD
jgi:hypothetical protein